MINSVIPEVFGVSELQKKYRGILNKSQNNGPVFLSDRNKISHVILSKKDYISLRKKHDENFWNQAQESSLDFWDHPSNNAYDEL